MLVNLSGDKCSVNGSVDCPRRLNLSYFPCLRIQIQIILRIHPHKQTTSGADSAYFVVALFGVLGFLVVWAEHVNRCMRITCVSKQKEQLLKVRKQLMQTEKHTHTSNEEEERAEAEVRKG